MAKSSGLTNANITALQQYVKEGYTVNDIVEIMGVPKTTIYRWLKELDLKASKGNNNGNGKEKEPEPKKEEPTLEDKIRVQTEDKHVKGLSTALSKLTIDREMTMREVAATLEKHAPLLESVRSMGMKPVEFLDLAITLTYEDVKETYLEKIEQIDEDYTREMAIRMLNSEGKNGS